MSELRRFDRIEYACRFELLHHGSSHHGRLENVSQNGALLYLDEEVEIPPGRICLLNFQPHEDQSLPPVKLWAVAVHGCATLLGVTFVGCDAETDSALLQLMQRLRADSGIARKALEQFRKYLEKQQHTS